MMGGVALIVMLTDEMPEPVSVRAVSAGMYAAARIVAVLATRMREDSTPAVEEGVVPSNV